MRNFLYIVLGILVLLIIVAIPFWLLGLFLNFIWFVVRALPVLVVVAIVVAVILYITGGNAQLRR